jgi:hypothetical protein
MVRPTQKEELDRPNRKVFPDKITARADVMKLSTVKMYPHNKDNVKHILLATDGYQSERPQIKVSFANKPSDSIKINEMLTSYDAFQSKKGKPYHKYNETNSRIFTGGVSEDRGFSSSKRIHPKDSISGLITYSDGPKFRNEVFILM